MSIFRHAQWESGEGLIDADMSNSSQFLRSQMFDTLGALARVTQLGAQPPTGYLFSFGNGGAPYTALSGLVLKNAPGPIAQVFSGFADAQGTEPRFRVYYAAADELQTTLSAADPTFPRIDLVCVLIDEADGPTETRHFEDEATGDLTSTSAVPTRVARLTRQVVIGTPAASPVEPAVPAGYVKWAAIRVEAAAASLISANLYDHRMPVGLRAYDLMGMEGYCDPAKWTQHNFIDRGHTDATLDTLTFLPRLGGNLGRLVAIEMNRAWDPAGGTPIANLKRLEFDSGIGSGPAITQLRSCSALVGASGSAFGAVALDLSSEAWWTNGYHCGYSFAVEEQSLTLVPARFKLGLRWEAGGNGAEYVRLARFWIAGG